MQTSDSQLIHRRVFLVLLIVYTVLYLGFFFYDAFSFPAKHFLPTFRARWTLNNAGLRFISILPTLHCTTIILTISFSARSTYTGSLNKSIGGTIVVFLVFTAIYAVFVEGIEPWSLRQIERFRYQTQVARIIYDKAQTAYDEERYNESWGFLEYYRTVDPGNKDAAELMGYVTKRLADDAGKSADEGDGKERPARLIEQSPSELIALADSYLANEDVFSAYYYAKLAKETARQNGEAWQRADRICAVAAAAIDALELSMSERREAELYSTKRRGIEALGTNDPERMIEGYYIFEILSLEYPDDAEVRRYYKIASDATTGITFFLDEARSITPLPGSRNIVFVNSEAEASLHELVKIGKIVKLDAKMFAEDIEVIGLDANGEAVYHFAAPFAQYMGGVLLLRGIDRQDPAIFTAPTYYTGEPPEKGAAILALRPTVEQLVSLSTTTSGFDDRGFFQLLELTQNLPEFGFSNLPAKASALDRVTAPFTYFILSIFAVALAIRFSPERGKPPIFSYILIPAVPVVLYGLIEIYRYGMRLFTSFLSLDLELTSALLLVIAGQLVVLIIAIFFLAATHAKLNEES